MFLIQGIGDGAKGWSKGLRAAFRTLSDSYALPLGGLSFSEVVETSEIYYKDLFHGSRKRAAKEADAALRMLGDGGLASGAVERLLQAGKAARATGKCLRGEP